MVKSGEVYTTDNLSYDPMGFIQNVSSRPRLISNPSNSMIGLTSAVTVKLLEIFKDIEKGFIYKMDSKQLASHISDNVKSDWVSLSIDGSAFDSTQYEDIMKKTDGVIENMFLDYIMTHFNDSSYT